LGARGRPGRGVRRIGPGSDQGTITLSRDLNKHNRQGIRYTIHDRDVDLNG
jgi:hypothetical protein